MMETKLEIYPDPFICGVGNHSFHWYSITKTYDKKNILNKKFIFLSFFILVIALFHIKAQHKVGIKLYGGLTKMRYTPNSPIGLNFIYIEIKNPVKIQPNGGLYYNYHLNNTVLFGIEVIYTQFQYAEQIKLTHLTSTNYTRYDININFSYLGLPFYIGRKSEKFTAYVGLMPLILINDDWRRNEELNINNKLSFAGGDFNLDIDKLDMGFRVGFVYNIYKRTYFESNYYSGMNNLFVKDDKETAGEYLYNQQLSVGLRFDIFK